MNYKVAFKKAHNVEIKQWLMKRRGNMNYKVTFENAHIVEIRHKNVCFSIKKESDTLYELRNEGSPTDVVIPNIFPSGHQIRYLNSTSTSGVGWNRNMVQGAFNEISISDNIIVGREAFQNANVKKVIWNDCPCIPSYCFQGSKVEDIANIENVNEIMRFAFTSCSIREMTWPAGCDTIPNGCFLNNEHFSKITVSDVRKIEEYAFAFSSIDVFDWPAGCTEIPKHCFSGSKLAEINNIDGVTAIGELAFSETRLKTLDLSDTNISYLAPRALMGLPENCELTLPYYISSEICNRAIGDR